MSYFREYYRDGEAIAGGSFRAPADEQAWAAAWSEHHGKRQYQDHPKALPPQPLQTKRDYGCNHVTMGGVASYG